MGYTIEHEKKILRGLRQNFKYREDLLEHLRAVTFDGGIKKMFPSTGKNSFSNQSLIAKARSISYEALVKNIDARLPEAKPKEPKKTAAEIRTSMFDDIPRMTQQQLKNKDIQDAIAAAKEAIEKRKETGLKIKAKAAEKKAAAEAAAEAAAKEEKTNKKSAKAS